MPVRMRKVLLFGSLAAIVGYALLDQPATRPGLAVAESGRAEPRAAAKGAPVERLELPERRGLSPTQGELFRAPAPPAPAAKKPQPAPVAAAPVAPPVPYRFAGKVRKGSEEEVLIAKRELVFPVKAGDTLDGVYKVESVSAERIELVYLPLGTPNHIVVSSALDAERAQPPLAAAPDPTRAAPATASAGPGAGPAQLRWEGPDHVVAGEHHRPSPFRPIEPSRLDQLDAARLRRSAQSNAR
jgi:hypothetical protein